MYDEAITLISQTETTDDYGDIVVVPIEKTIFAALKSIGQTEFYQAQAVGLKPEIKFVIADYLDYSGEELLKYTPFQGEEETYNIIRTYRNGNTLEITCARGIK